MHWQCYREHDGREVGVHPGRHLVGVGPDDRVGVQVSVGTPTWKKGVMTFLGAIYGAPGLVFLWHGDMFGAAWGIGFGLICLWMAKN